MSMFSKLTGLAQKALDKNSSSKGNAAGPGAASGSGQTDWRSVVRSAADALTGDGRPTDGGRATGAAASAPASSPVPTSASAPAAARGAASPATDLAPADRAAIARYDYLLQTADPHQIEQVHREAFERLTPEQRAQIEARMTDELPEHERPKSSGSDDLARAATRTEMGRPGMLRGLLARAGSLGSGSGARSGVRNGAIGGAVAGAGIAAGGVLAAVAGGAILSSVAGPLLEQAGNLGVDFESLANGIDVESLTGGLDGLTGGVDELAAGAGETVSGLGESVAGLGENVSGLGDQVRDLASGFEIPGFKDFFGR